MKINRIQNSKRGIYSGVINRIISTLMPFIIRTILIHKIGAEYLGLTSLFTSILQVLSLTELGMSNAIVYSMYKPIAEDDQVTLNGLLHFYKKVYKIVGFIMLALGILVLPFLHLFIKNGYPKEINIYIIFIMYVFNTSISYLLFAYKQSIFQALQRTDLSTMLNTITIVTQSIAQIILLLTFSNYYLYVLTLPIFTIFNSILIAIMTKKKYPEFVAEGEITKEQKKELIKHIKGILLSKVCFTLRNGLDSIIISIFLGLTSVAVFNNYYYVINAVLGFFVIIINSLTAGVGNSVASESVEKNYNDMCTITFLYAWLAGGATNCLFCILQPFMELWVGSEYLVSLITVIAFCAYFYVNTMGHIRGMYQDAVGLWWESRTRAIAETVMNLIMNVILVKYMGVLGVVVASLVSMLLINFGMGTQIVFKYYFKEYNINDYFGQYISYIATCVFSCILSYGLCSLIRVNNLIFSIVIRAIVCFVLYNVIYFLVYRKNVWLDKGKKLLFSVIKR